MVQVWNLLKGKKTYVVSGVTVLLYVLQHFGLTIPGVTTITPEMVEAAVLGATIRHGVSTSAPVAPPDPGIKAQS